MRQHRAQGPQGGETGSTAAVEYTTVRTAARRLGISRALISRAVHLGLIPAYRPGRRWLYVRLDDARAWLHGHRLVPQAAQIVERVDRSVRRSGKNTRSVSRRNANDKAC